MTVRSHEGHWVEIQIRTKTMDDVAEKGSAAHWKYKEDDDGGQFNRLDTWLVQIRNILEQPSHEVDTILDTL